MATWKKHGLVLTNNNDNLDFAVALATIHTMGTAKWDAFGVSCPEQRELPVFASHGPTNKGGLRVGTLLRRSWEDEAHFEFWTKGGQDLGDWLLERSDEWPTVGMALETSDEFGNDTMLAVLDGEFA